MSFAPTASLQNLRLRAEVLKKIRAFFEARNILEVETPVLCHSTVTSPHLHSIEAQVLLESQKTYYLQTSPEFAMKRLLAAGSGDIYQITKAFRNEESGSLHNPEFTMLEWYRVGFNHIDLMKEMDTFLQSVAETQNANRYTYQDLFKTFAEINPFEISQADLCFQIKRKGIEINNLEQFDRDHLLDLLLSHCIEPHLGMNNTPVFVYDFPASQAALAKIRQDSHPVAERFEVYLNGMELANGFHELIDSEEQEQRFLSENKTRKTFGLKEIPLDNYFLDALKSGLPACAGVALGIDRLIMAILKTRNIHDVLTFPIDRA